MTTHDLPECLCLGLLQGGETRTSSKRVVQDDTWLRVSGVGVVRGGRRGMARLPAPSMDQWLGVWGVREPHSPGRRSIEGLKQIIN
jgi:hypothetical protein